MTTPVYDPTTHYVVIKTEHMADKVVRCTCGWESRGHRFHPERAQMAGERHIKEQAQ